MRAGTRRPERHGGDAHEPAPAERRDDAAPAGATEPSSRAERHGTPARVAGEREPSTGVHVGADADGVVQPTRPALEE